MSRNQSDSISSFSMADSLSSSDIKQIKDIAKSKYDITLFSELENYDSCELTMIRRLYMSFRDYQTETGKKCLDDLSPLSERNMKIFIKGPTSLDILGYDEPFLNYFYLFEQFIQHHINDLTEDNSWVARGATRLLILKILNQVYKAKSNDDHYRFDCTRNGVIFDMSFAHLLTNQRLTIMKESLVESIIKIKDYFSRNQHLKDIQEINKEIKEMNEIELNF